MEYFAVSMFFVLPCLNKLITPRFHALELVREQLQSVAIGIYRCRRTCISQAVCRLFSVIRCPTLRHSISMLDSVCHRTGQLAHLVPSVKACGNPAHTLTALQRHSQLTQLTIVRSSARQHDGARGSGVRSLYLWRTCARFGRAGPAFSSVFAQNAADQQNQRKNDPLNG